MVLSWRILVSTPLTVRPSARPVALRAATCTKSLPASVCRANGCGLATLPAAPEALILGVQPFLKFRRALEEKRFVAAHVLLGVEEDVVAAELAKDSNHEQRVGFRIVPGIPLLVFDTANREDRGAVVGDEAGPTNRTLFQAELVEPVGDLLDGLLPESHAGNTLGKNRLDSGATSR